MEDLSNLDASMFTRHPDGYICRCGLPEHCVCPTDFPEAVVADFAAELKRLRDGIAWLSTQPPDVVEYELPRLLDAR